MTSRILQDPTCPDPEAIPLINDLKNHLSPLSTPILSGMSYDIPPNQNIAMKS